MYRSGLNSLKIDVNNISFNRLLPTASTMLLALDPTGYLSVTDSLTNTDDLPEGSVNKYYSTALFDTDLGLKTSDNITQGIVNKYYSSSLFDTDLGFKTTDNITEGITNKYYSTSLFDTDLGLKTTSNLIEGTNLYFTTARAQSAFTAGSNITIDSGVISAALSVGLFADGSVAAPSISFASDTNTGFFYKPNAIFFSSNGIDTGGHLWSGGIRVIGGSAGSPSLGFAGDINSGIYLDTATSDLRISIDGIDRANFDATRALIQTSLSVFGQLLASSGTAPLPGIAFAQDPNTGLHYSPDGIFWSTTNEAAKCHLWQSGLRVHSGSAAVPSLSFTDSNNSGMYSPATNEIGLAAGGIKRITIDAFNIKMYSDAYTFRDSVASADIMRLTNASIDLLNPVNITEYVDQSINDLSADQVAGGIAYTSNSGYQSSGGVIHQWGWGVSNSDTAQTFKFLKTFGSCFTVHINLRGGGFSTQLSCSSFDSFGFTIDRDNALDGSVRFTWHAVGNSTLIA